MLTTPDQLLDTLGLVYPTEPPPKALHLPWAVYLVARKGLDAEEAARRAGIVPRRLARILDSVDWVQEALAEPLLPLEPQVAVRSRQSLGQLVIGNIAERVFEEIYRDTIGTTELRLEDDRGSRGETDYLVFNGQGRQVFRINIKFHGALFRRAQELVGLDPEDCFALATYKIVAAIKKQDAEHLPYIFVIVGVRGLTAAQVGEAIPDDLVHLAALPRLMKRVGGLRQIEDQIVEVLVAGPLNFGVEAEIGNYIDQIRDAQWFVLSARRAEHLLRDKLFERVYALTVRAFSMNYRGAELDMHFSLKEDLTPLGEFLSVLRDHGMPGLVGRLERGTL